MTPTGMDKATRSLCVGIAGLGTVGQALISVLERHAGLYTSRTGCKVMIGGVSARSRDKSRSVDISGYKWFDDPVELAGSDEIDVLVEVIGDLEQADAVIRAGLHSGKHVVTANKALLSEKGSPLIALAQQKGLYLGFEAAVCTAIPVVKVLRETLASGRIQSVRGIFNGTSNYILERMAEGVQYADALKEAQEAGYAEADPTLDVGGGDAAHKAALMAGLIAGQNFDYGQIYLQGLDSVPDTLPTQLAREGLVLKMLGVIDRQEDRRWALWVYPAALSDDHPLAHIDGLTNAVHYVSDTAGAGMLQGVGAGGQETASALMADLIDIALDRATIGGGLSSGATGEIAPISSRFGDYWIMLVQDSRLRSALGRISRSASVSGSSMLLHGVLEQDLLKVIAAHDQRLDWVRVEEYHR